MKIIFNDSEEVSQLARMEHTLRMIEGWLKRLNFNLHSTRNMLMSTLDDILNDEAQESTTLGQLATAVQALMDNAAALKAALDAALANTTIPPDVQTKIDAAFVASDANSKAVGDILAKLTPPATTPVDPNAPPVDPNAP